MHAYPRDLARSAHERWRELAAEAAAEAGIAPAAGLDHLEELVSTAYQASLLHEEDRPVTFRLLVGDPAVLPEGGGPPDGLHRLTFTRPRPFSDHELRRLSPAAKYHRALIGVRWDAVAGRFVIWGMVQSGPRWLRSAHGGRGASLPAPAHALVVRATGPGRLSLAVGTHTLAEIRGGRIGRTRLDVFDSRWLSARFATSRQELFSIHDQARRQAKTSWAELEPDVTRLISQHMLRRVVATMRAAHHGGTLVFFPTDCAKEVVTNGRWLQLKYMFADDEPRRRFRTLILAVMAAVAEEGGAAGARSAGFREYEASHSRRLAALDEAIYEMANLIAALADVDGAVAMTQRFELLGFGGEITGELPQVDVVRRALDLEAHETEPEETDGVGTRHRSAYRLCAASNEAIALVVSQDGTVRFVSFFEGAVTFWEHVSLASSEG